MVSVQCGIRASFAFLFPFLYQYPMQRDEVIPILDFGSQYAQLIARRVREKGVYSQLVRPYIPADEPKRRNLQCPILSSRPSSAYEANAPLCDPQILDLGVPMLGLC